MKSFVFRSFYGNRGERFLSSSGSSVVPEYQLHIDSKGVRSLKVVGQKDLYAEIQSHKDSCDVHNILKRFANGDTSVLDQRLGYFADATNFPKSYAEMYQRVVDGETFFNGLPVDIRKEFNFNPVEFFSQMGTDSFNAIMSQFSERPNGVDDKAAIDEKAAIDGV